MKTAVTPRNGRPGPAPTGKGTPVVVRIQPEPLAILDSWIKRQKQPLSRPEAIRCLVEIGLATPPAKRARRGLGRSLDLGHMAKLTPDPVKTTRHSWARELAADAMDKMHDPAASTEERDERQRGATKGTPEFCEDRVVLPNAKGK